MEVNASSNAHSTTNSAHQLLVPKHQTNSSMNSTACIPKLTAGYNVNKYLEISGDEILQAQGTSKMMTGTLHTTIDGCGQGDTKNNAEKTNSVSAKLNDNRSSMNSCSYSTSAILVPVISTTSGRNILEEMKRKVAHTLLHQQRLPSTSTQNLKSSLVPGTNVEYRTPGANHKNKNGRIKRPMNAFMVWARDCRSHLATSMPNATNSEISVRLGQIWAAMKPEDKRKYYDIAERIKVKHRKDYPDWVYQPNSPGMKKKEEAINYGRTPTPPPNNEHIDGVPATTDHTSSNVTGTQQTTIVVLSNDNKITHTKLTTSQSLLLQKNQTTSPLSASRTFAGSPGKVVPAAVTSNNIYQGQLEKFGTISTKDVDNKHKLTLPVYRSLSNSPRNIKTPADLTKVQYQSAMEVTEVNKVTDKTKDLLATKIISARPFDQVSCRMNQTTKHLNDDIVNDASRLSEREHSQAPEAHAQYKTIEQANKYGNNRESAQQISKEYSSTVTFNTMARQNNPTVNQVEPPKNNGSGYVQLTRGIPINRPVTNQAMERKQTNESINTVRSEAATEENKQTVATPTAIGSKSDNSRFTNVQLTNVPCRYKPMMMNPVNRAPFNLGMNFRTPNVRPVLARMMGSTTGNNVRQDMSKIRPKVPTISNPFNIPVAESWISPTSTPVRLVTSHTDAAQNQPSNTKQSSVSMTTVQQTDKERLQSTKNEVDIKPEIDVSHRTEDGTDSMPVMPAHIPYNVCVEEMQIKKEDELWPFSFSDNPGDWSREDMDPYMYVEMIDPFDPFLGPGDMLAEMYPGSLKLDMDRWKDYLNTKPDEPTDYLESCFLDNTDDITISPVPLRETLQRLVNTETQVSDTCDVISGDLITQGDEKGCDLTQDLNPAILTDDLARQLSGIMRCVVSGNENTNETDSDTHAQNADDDKSCHVATYSTSLVEKSQEVLETDGNDETSKLPNDSDEIAEEDTQTKASGDTENTEKGSSVTLSNSEKNRRCILSTAHTESTEPRTIPLTTEVASDIKKNSVHKLKQNKETLAQVHVTPRRSTRSRTIRAT